MSHSKSEISKALDKVVNKPANEVNKKLQSQIDELNKRVTAIEEKLNNSEK